MQLLNFALFDKQQEIFISLLKLMNEIKITVTNYNEKKLMHKTKNLFLSISMENILVTFI